jgi:hypothetical protein
MKYASYTERSDPHTYVFLSVPCPDCGSQESIEVKGPDLYRYNQGGHVQDVFPYLSPAQRERLITGVCGPCFEKMFA